MQCSQCQNVMTPQDRFCSRCGRDSVLDRVRPAALPRARDWDVHLKVFAWILIGSAALMALPGVGFVFGQSFRMMGRSSPSLAGPSFAMMMGILLLAIPCAIICTGVGLLQYHEWSRVIALILSAFLLILLPFGTVLGIYGFWVLTSNGGSENYKMRSAQLAT